MRYFMWAVVLVFFPNALVNALGLVVFINRPLINVDYFIILVPVLAGWRRVSVFLLAGILVVDILFSLAPAWHFQAGSALRSVEDIVHLDGFFVIMVILAAILAVVMVSELLLKMLFYRLSGGHVEGRLVVLLGLGFLFAGVVGLDFAAKDDGSPSFLDGVNVAGSGLNNIRVAVGSVELMGDVHPVREETMYSRIVGYGERQALPKTTILIVVESLGAFGDMAMNDRQMDHLVEVVSKRPDIHFKRGEMGFSGSTVPAEVRELCGLQTSSTHPHLAPHADRCLPAILRGYGYSSMAVHGFTGAMFSRNIWYPELGFDSVLFAPELMAQGAGRRCGRVFSGICDTTAWQWILQHVGSRKDEKTFVYWLTLSAHLPLPKNPQWVDDDDHDCEDGSFGPQMSASVCALFRVHRQLFRKIAEGIDSGDLEDALLLVVGDHAPPFLSRDDRGKFDPENVPYLEILIPAASH